MPQLKVRIKSKTDQERFNTILARLLDTLASSTELNGDMISVRTDLRVDYKIKTICCDDAQALSHFRQAYDGELTHA